MSYQTKAIIAARGGMTGFGSKYADALALPPFQGTGVAFSPSGNSIAVSHYTSPCISAYPFSLSSGIGTRFSNPASVVTGSNGWGVDFHPSGNAIALVVQFSPYVIAYQWSDSTGFGSRFNPSTVPAGPPSAVKFSPNGNYVAVAHNTSPFFAVYPFSVSTGFGTRISTSGITLPTGKGNDIVFSPNNDLIAVAHDTSPYLSVYPFDSATGTIGNKLANPASLPISNSDSVAFNRNGSAVAFGISSAIENPLARIYRISTSTGFGSAYTDSTNNGIGKPGLAFSPSGNTLAAATSGNLMIAARWNDTAGFASFYTNQTLSGAPRRIAFHPSGNAIAAAIQPSPYFVVYQFNE